MPPLPANSTEVTESLFVPLFKKGQFLLGDLHGEISPNGLGLRMMTNIIPGTAPVQIARRFCVDLSICDAVEFLEYEWFSDGNVIVSMHSVDLDGDYSGISIVLDCSEEDQVSPIAVSGDLVSPLKVVMRVNYTETVDCGVCKDSRATCRCLSPQTKLVDLSPHGSETCIDWATWVSAFAKTRTGSSTTTASFRVVTPMGEVPGVMSFRLDQTAEMGEESGLALIRRQYEKLRATQVPPVHQEAVVEEATAVEYKVYESFEGIDDFLDCMLPKPHTPDDISPTAPNDSAGEDGVFTMSDVSPSDSRSNTQTTSTIRKPRMPGGQVLEGGVKKKGFVCSDCGVEFSQKGHLNVHIMTKHRRLRPHLCTECSATFSKRSDLRRHAKTVHNMESLNDDEDPVKAALSKPFPCGHCEKRYATRQGARKHLNAKHPNAVSSQ